MPCLALKQAHGRFKLNLKVDLDTFSHFSYFLTPLNWGCKAPTTARLKQGSTPIGLILAFVVVPKMTSVDLFHVKLEYLQISSIPCNDYARYE